MNPRRAIFRRYAWVISGALAGTLLAAGLVEMAFSLRENLDRARDLHVSEARVVFGRVSAIFEEVSRNFLAVANAPWSFAGDPEARTREYQRLMRLLPSVKDVTFVDAEGREQLFLSRTEPRRVGSQNRVELGGAGAAKPGATYVGRVRPGAVGSAPQVHLAFRDRDAAGALTVVTVNLQFLSEELARIRRPGEAPYVIDDQGHLIAHADITRPLKDASVTFRLVPQATEGSEWRLDESGDRVLAVWHRFSSPPWTLGVDLPLSTVLKPVMSTLYRTLALVAFAIVISFVVAGWLARRMAQPIVALKNGVAAYGAGQLASRIQLETNDELQELAEAFNVMAAQIRDYTEGLERRVEEKTEELQGALALAQEAMRARAIFLAAASHDLRQPLYAISLLADALANERLPGRAEDVVEKQRRAIRVLRRLFDNLLDLSRFDAGEVRVRLREFRLREVLAPLSGEHELAARAKGLDWRTELDDVWVRSDPELLRRLVGNLLSNAVRYTRAGTVTLKARDDEGRVVVEVEDTGIGIAPADQKRVFEEFVQLDNPGRDRDQGVGLGLSIVKRICDLMAIPIELRSVVGAGTRISVRLPTVAAPAATSPEGLPSALVRFPGLTAWAVEDDPLVREALRAQFEAWDAKVEIVADEPGALALLDRSDVPDVAILDDSLGDGPRGLELAERFAARMLRERILLVTGNVDPKRVEALESSGFVVFLKPLASEDLAAWIRDVAATTTEA